MEIINYETAEINERLARVDTLESRVSGLTGLKFVNSTAEMTDTTRIYVNAADGNWYEYSGGSWISRGQYGGVQVDAELKTAGAAAEAKATGDLKTNYVLSRYNEFLNGQKFLPALFTRGARKVDTGKYVTANYRVTTTDSFRLERDAVVKIETGFILDIYRVTGPDSVSHSNAQNYARITAGYDYYVAIRRETEDTSEIADVSEFVSAVYIDPQTDVKIQSVVQSGNVGVPCAFIRGFRRLSDGLILPVGYCITSAHSFRVDKETTYIIQDGFKLFTK
jgi:hypothetical protein